MDLSPKTATGHTKDLDGSATTMWMSKTYTCKGEVCMESSRRVYCFSRGVYWDLDKLREEK